MLGRTSHGSLFDLQRMRYYISVYVPMRTHDRVCMRLVRHYTGSLTTPPCQTKSGGKVEWFVMQTPDTVTTTDLYQFTSYFSSLDKVSPYPLGASGDDTSCDY